MIKASELSAMGPQAWHLLFGSVNQLYTLCRVLKGAWEFAQPVFSGFEEDIHPCPSGSPVRGSPVWVVGSPDSRHLTLV